MTTADYLLGVAMLDTHQRQLHGAGTAPEIRRTPFFARHRRVGNARRDPAAPQRMMSIVASIRLTAAAGWLTR